MPQRPQPSLRLADGGNFITRWAQNVMRPGNTDKRLREIEAPPPAPVVRPAPPPPPSPNATPDNPAGIRFQDGGVVPGTGKGDKIPAKYEPGEFVVSNDMIDDNPGLRELLSGLRAETLAARGKTVEEADAKALRYHGGLRGGEHGQGTRNEELQATHAGGRNLQRVDWPADRVLLGRGGGAQGARHTQVTLRAADGFDPLGRMARDLTGQNSLPPKTPVGNMADDLTRNARAAPPAPPPGPTNPGMANPQARAAYAEMARAAAPTSAPIEPAAPKAPSAASKWIGSGEDWKKTLSPVADSPHKTGRMTIPGAPSGFGKGVLALQGAMGAKDVYDGIQEGDAWKTGVGAADAVAGAALFTPAAPVAGAYLGLRGAYDTAKAVGGAVYDRLSEGAQDVIGGTVNQIGLNTGLWGVDDSAKLMADAQARAGQPADTLRKTAPAQNTLSNPYANVTPEQGRAMAEVNAIAPGRAPGSQPTPQEAPFDFDTFEPGPGEGAFRNEQTGKVTRLTPTPQGAAWRAAPAQRATPAQQALVSPAPRLRQEVRAPVLNPNGGIFAAMADFTNQAGRATQAIAANKGLRNDRRDALDAESTFAKIDQGDRGLQLRGREADMLEKDLGLRREGQTALARFKQQELAYNRQRDALKDAMELERHTQTISHNATNNARDRLKGMAVRDDGKGGTVVDEGRLARLESTLAKMSPGWAQADEATQAKLLRKAEASVNILEGLNSQRNNGWLQALGVDGKSAQLDNLPHKEMKGAKLGEVGFVEGAKTPGTSHKDYVIETSGGHKLYLPRSSVNQGELELLKSLGVDITGTEK